MSRPLRHSRTRCGGIRRCASDPTPSAWVSANAGSGKTHVLTQRVLRLLLAGAKPAQILGLTFTKAAAANMAGRIFEELAEWTSLDDETLAEAIVETGAGRPGPPDARLRPAIVRAHDRDAGRAQDPDAARLLRAAACSSSRSRPMSRPISRSWTSARPRR